MKRYRFALIICSFTLFACGNQSQQEEKNSSKDTVSTDLNTTVSELRQVCNCLNQADETDPESAAKCMDQYKEQITHFNTGEADSLYRDLFTALERVTLNVSPEINDETDYNDKGELNPELRKKAQLNGLDYDSEEGTPFYAVYYPYLHNLLYEKLSPSMKLFDNFKMNNRDKISYDAGLVITPMEQAKRVVEMEKIIADGPFVMQEQLMQQFSYEILWLMTGMDNTPAFDWETNIMNNETKAALEYASKNGEKITRDIVNQYLDLMKKNNWKPIDPGVWDLFPIEKTMDQLKAAYHLEV